MNCTSYYKLRRLIMHFLLQAWYTCKNFICLSIQNCSSVFGWAPSSLTENVLPRLNVFNYYLKFWLFLLVSAAHLCGLKWDLDCLINNRLWSTSLEMEFTWREEPNKSCKCNCMISSSPLVAQIINYFKEEAQESNHSSWIYHQNAGLLHICMSRKLDFFFF